MKLVIKNGIIVNPARKQHEKGDIVIENGKILSIGGTADTEGAEVYDANGLFVAPGLIDMHVHLREPGQEAKEDIHTGTQAAAAGGITRVATMANTKPVIDNAAVFRDVLRRVDECGVVKVSVIGALSKNLEGKQLSEMGDMAAEGAAAFSDDGHYVESANFMRRAMEYADMLHKMVIDHAEDATMCSGGFMNEGKVSYAMGVTGRPAAGEDIAVARDLLLSEMTGCHIHIAHVSSAKAVELIREAKAKHVNCTTEVTSQHLYFTDEWLKNYESSFKMAPPIRTEDDRKALIEGLKDGTIDAIITDHAPHCNEEKDVPFNCAPNGIAGLETSLASALTVLCHNKGFTIDRLIELMSVNPARLLGVEGGVLEEGAAADIVVIDPDKEWTVHGNELYTKSLFTPYEGLTLKGRAVLTVVDGEIVMKEGKVLK
ncbi:dihydroorotase [Dialister hominis]|uniref:dihydroorotase n=2 Tax=Veillonellaceae TaxID=31977 RepID=UPI0025963D66|nr:dihydroorotase [uncultured Dialister sp.]